MARRALLLLALLLAGCPGEVPPGYDGGDVEDVDAGSDIDAARPVDAGPPDSAGPCSHDTGVDNGECMDYMDCEDMGGDWLQGLCPGPGNIRCCVL
jgi:hypothetical protein